MEKCLETIADVLGYNGIHKTPWHKLTPEDVADTQKALSKRFAGSTVNKHLSALKGVLKESWRSGLMSDKAFDAAVDFDRVKTGIRKSRVLTPAEIKALFRVCEDDRNIEVRCDSAVDEARRLSGYRDAALLALLYGCGLKRSEVMAAELKDFNWRSHTLRVDGRKITPVGGAAKAIIDWISERKKRPGPLLCPISRSGIIMIHRLSDQGIMYALWRRSEQAKIDRVSPSDLRHAFVDRLLSQNTDLATVQELLGHVEIASTARYDRRKGNEEPRMPPVPY